MRMSAMRKMGFWTISIFVGILFAVIAFSGDPVIATDTPLYLSIADDLRSQPADVIFAKDRALVTVLTLPSILVLARDMAPNRWPYIIVFVNVVSMALAAGLLIAVVRLVTKSALASLAALVAYVTSYDVIAWLRYVLTDNIFVLVATGVFYLLIRGIVRDERSVRRRVGLGFALFVAFITRAAGAVLVPVVIFSEWWSHRGPARGRFSRTAPWILVLVVGAGGMFVRAYLFADLRRWPTEFLRPALETYAVREKGGEVVYDRVEARRAPPQSTADFVVLQADRFVRFFQFTTAGFSRTHNLVNTAYFVPFYLLALFGLFDGLWRDRTRRTVVAVTTLWILSVAWLHALTVLDFDWRYRLPVMPMLILLAACGVEGLAGRIAHRLPGPDAPAADATSNL